MPEPYHWDFYTYPGLTRGNVICPNKEKSSKETITTPSQTQKGFAKLLEKIGTPAQDCVARGKPCGRIQGEQGVKKSEQPIIFKNKKVLDSSSESILSESEKEADYSDPQKIDELAQMIKKKLSQINFSPEQFAKVLLGSG